MQYAQHWGIEYTFVDATDAEEYRKALQPNTRVVYTESPANPTCRLTDLNAVSRICDEHAAKGHTRPIIMCDSTFATPFHQRCLEYPGVDIAIHSATKYIGGHSDIVAGAVTSKSTEVMHEVAKAQKLIGAALAPLESFLLARGLRTLHVRMERHGENAMRVAEFLDSHPLIESTFYPGLPSHPDHELAKEVFTSGGAGCMSRREQSFGGMLAFIVKGDDETALRRARRLCERLELITLAVSLGGTESLIEHPASMTHTMIPRRTASPAASPTVLCASLSGSRILTTCSQTSSRRLMAATMANERDREGFCRIGGGGCRRWKGTRSGQMGVGRASLGL